MLAAQEHSELKKQYAELNEAYQNFKRSEEDQSRSRSRSQPYGSRREVETADDSAIISVNTHAKENRYQPEYSQPDRRGPEPFDADPVPQRGLPPQGPPRNLQPIVMALDADESHELSMGHQK